MHEGGVLGESEGSSSWVVAPHPRINCPFARGVWGGIHGIGLMHSHTSRPSDDHTRTSAMSICFTTMSCSRAGLVNLYWLHSVSGALGSALCAVPLFHRGCAFLRLPHWGLEAFEEAGDSSSGTFECRGMTQPQGIPVSWHSFRHPPYL